MSSEQRYLHGYRPEEIQRLHRQARFLEPKVHNHLPFVGRKRLLEVGCGVGAQTAILLRTLPALHVTGVDLDAGQLAEARRFLDTVPSAVDRFDIRHMAAETLEFDSGTFDSAFLCWVLEHVPTPQRVLGEVHRVLAPGAPVVCTEVLNSTLFLHPHSPATLRYWTAYNEHQIELRGDPFVGAKLGNLLRSSGFVDVASEAKVFHLDSGAPAERSEMVGYWRELLLSGAPGLFEAGKVSTDLVDGVSRELERVAQDPDGVFFYVFIQARARRG